MNYDECKIKATFNLIRRRLLQALTDRQRLMEALNAVLAVEERSPEEYEAAYGHAEAVMIEIEDHSP